MSDTVRQQAEREAAASRVMARADRLAALSETADALTRVYLSPEHLQANQLVGQWMQAAGMMVWQDSVGNICGRYEGVQEGAGGAAGLSSRHRAQRRALRRHARRAGGD